MKTEQQVASLFSCCIGIIESYSWKPQLTVELLLHEVTYPHQPKLVEVTFGSLESLCLHRPSEVLYHPLHHHFNNKQTYHLRRRFLAMHV